MKHRNPFLVILFSIITSGIYTIYWFVAVTNEIERTLKAKDGSVKSGGMTILLTIVTCGIYMFYWWYKQGQRVNKLGDENGVFIGDNAVLYLVLCFVFVPVNMILLQISLNKIAAVDAH